MLLIIIALACVFAAFLVLLWLTPLGVPRLKRLGGGAMSPDLRFGYRPDQTYQLLSAYGPAGIGHWRRMLWLDMVFPAVYGALFALLGVVWSTQVRASLFWTILAVTCPIAAALSDYAENILLLRVLRALPERRDGNLRAASLLTRSKFTFSWTTLAILLLEGIATLLR